MNRLTILFLVVANLLFLSSVQADERILPKAEFERMGFKPVKKPAFNVVSFLAGPPFAAHELAWPVTFADSEHTVAQNYVNFQQYGGDLPYYHGGCDLRAQDHADILAPIAGRLEAGYYGYTDNPDGSIDKQWNAWNGNVHDDPYFEIAVVTDDNYRFEFHHVNSLNLPSAIVDKLNAGNARVEQGELLGYVNGAPFPNYEHTHYNIIDPNGVRLNPEYYSQTLADHTAPKIYAVFAVDSAGRATKITDGAQLNAADVAKFVVATTDSHDNDVYVQTPVYASVQFDQSKTGFTWDFRRQLLGPDQKFPDIRSFITPSISAEGESYETSGQYGAGMFLLTLPVTAADSGAFRIQIGDTSDNLSTTSGTLQK